MRIILLLFSAYSAGKMHLFLRIATKKVSAIESIGESSIKNILSCWKKVVLVQIKKCKNMETTVERTRNNNSSIMHYWGLVKNLDDKLKLELVSMLISSMRLSSVADEEEREKGFRSLSGCWANDHGDDDIEAIIRKDRENRRGNRIIPSFDE